MNSIRLRFALWFRASSRLLPRASTLLFATLALNSVVASPAVEVREVDGTDDAFPARVFVLSVADYRSFNEDGLQGVKKDVEAVERFFQRHVPEQALEYTSVDPNAATPENVLDAIERLKEKDVGKNDVVFFYYSGHAAYDPEKEGGYLRLRDAAGKVQAVYRADVKKRLLSLNARLVVIFTDCCNKTYPVPPGMEFDSEPLPIKGMRNDYSPVMKRLFLDGKTRGIVDLTSSVPGEYSYAFRDGSIATTIAIKTFDVLNSDLEVDPSFVVDWRRFVDEWTQETEDVSRRRRQAVSPGEQKKQTPYAYELPESVRPRAFSGLAFSHSATEALTVASVKKDSPASRAGVRRNDVVKKFDGKEIAVVKDYRDALKDVSDDAEIVVQRDGKLKKLTLKGLRGGE